MDGVDRGVGEALRDLGFSVNESRAYVALVRDNPATGYELSRRAAIPRSAIYGVLRRLSDDGLVLQVGDKPARYAPLPPNDMARLLKRRFQSSLDRLEERMARLDAPAGGEELWQVQGYDALLDETEALVRDARTTLHLSLWRREALRLAAALEGAAARGVEVSAFSFCDLSELRARGVSVYEYGLREAELEEFWPHRLIAVADRDFALMGDAEQADEAVSVRTSNRTIVELAMTQVAMDLTLLGERRGVDVRPCVSSLQGRRIGRLDDLLARIS